MQTRVRWTEDERDLVIERMAEVIREAPRTKRVKLWEAGNEMLAPDRRRPTTVLYTEQAMFEKAEQRARIAVPSTAAVSEPVIEFVPVPTDVPLSSYPLRDLLAEVIERVIMQWTPAPVERHSRDEQAMPAVRGAIVDTQEEQKERPVRIGVCGLLPDQFRRVKERVNARKVELVLVSNDCDPAKSDWRRGMQHAIVTRFVRHGHTEQAREALGNSRVHWVASGVESVAAKVGELVPGGLN